MIVDPQRFDAVVVEEEESPRMTDEAIGAPPLSTNRWGKRKDDT